MNFANYTQQKIKKEQCNPPVSVKELIKEYTTEE